MTEHVLASMNESISYDFSSEHKALDIVPADGGDGIAVAFAEGTVESVVSNQRYTNHNSTGNATYGNYIVIKHPNGYKTLYAHLKYGSIMVNVGDYVSKEQRLATIGQTGNAYGVHLHFEIRGPDNIRVNPSDYLNGYNNAFNSISNNQDEVITNDVTQDEVPSSIDVVSENANNYVDDDKEEITNDNDDFGNTLENTELNNDDYLVNTSYTGGSIVDGLKGLGEDSSFDHRTILAVANGIDDYRGSYSQNVFLLKLLKSGELSKA